jgi:hypothetical protein
MPPSGKYDIPLKLAACIRIEAFADECE